MSFDLQKILESKRAFRRELAARPVAEKLRLLDALRKRQLAIRRRAVHSGSSTLREEPAPCRINPSPRKRFALALQPLGLYLPPASERDGRRLGWTRNQSFRGRSQGNP